MSAPSPGPPTDIVTMLRRHAHDRPVAACLWFGDDCQSFAELDARSDRVAAALAAAGIARGDRVAILSAAAPAMFELLFGCAKAGTILVPLNFRLSAREIADILTDAEPKLVLAAAEFAGLLPASLRPATIDLDCAYDAWRDAAPPASCEPIDREAPALILYTSGTTGLPKGAIISQYNLSFLGRMAGEHWDYTDRSINLVAMPLFHIGGIGYGLLALSQGGTTVLTRASEPGALLDVMARHRVTHAFFVPTVIQRLVDHVEEHALQPPQVPYILYGAAPIGEALLRRAIARFGSGFRHVYGMTETAGTTVSLDPADHDPDGPAAARLRSCGRPLPWVELTLVNPATGEQVAAGVIGEIRMRSDAIMRGYWRKPEETAAALTADGWLCSGDAATRDTDGYLYIQDRYKDMIVSGGENIYPSEIDNVLAQHPDLVEAAVIGVPHQSWGETPRAYAVARSGARLTEAEVIAFVRERLARYKCPTSVVFVDALPRNASGKILKRALRDQA